ncbi:acyl-CoA synthetases /AMP-acid ligases II [Gonapodya prolifera JEL478]|uniref:Acyl-CoA synthetases /AMP-acid ligases II n=1 Tax=Gonapodya prolifera (strain JEL478) TaxID=1344416 RepID=A0A139AUF7_GONPJ|nr:acyl-CoA synthetases /AMP-acid ligases II [Gonapodya prolifera JEL478]|eukprot:KXS20376.1 acyl-CoA synthetases /AMP-acid ligases II [Gonapodya prolifera JEL478]
MTNIPPPVVSHQEANRLLTTALGSPFELEERVIRGVKLRCWKNGPKSLRTVWESTQGRTGEYIAFYDENGVVRERITYPEAHKRVSVLADYLLAAGVVKGDRVAICMRNWTEWILIFWAIVSIGGIAVPINAWLTGPESEYCLTDSGSKVVFCDGERAERLRPHFANLRAAGTTAIVVSRSTEDFPGTVTLSSVFQRHAAAAQKGLPAIEIESDDDATIFYTSGTTGKPKGALATHRGWCSLLMGSPFFIARNFLRRGEPLPTPDPNFTPAFLIVTPLFHATGYAFTQNTTLSGGKIVLMFKWNPEVALKIIQADKITGFGGVPSLVWQMLEHPTLHKYDTSSLMGLTYGGAPSAPELMQEVKRKVPGAIAANGYGMTETCAGIIMNSEEDYLRKPDSVGVVNAAHDVKIMSEDGTREMPTGQIGEIWMKGPNVVKGYWRKPEANAKTFVDGFVKSGDLGYVDEEGFVFIRDRSKDMLIRGGENIYSVEVEDALYSHPSVMEAAVVGIPDRILGELVGAAVQIKPSWAGKVNQQELVNHCKPRLAGFKIPIFIDIGLEELPKNPNGKVLKPTVRDAVVAKYLKQSKL